jgi:hypothetical protein
MQGAAGRCRASQDWGLTAVEVQDNGSGISVDNYAGLALKHHTSKLRNFEHLDGVSSFGFRGEALATQRGHGCSRTGASSPPLRPHLRRRRCRRRRRRRLALRLRLLLRRDRRGLGGLRRGRERHAARRRRQPHHQDGAGWAGLSAADYWCDRSPSKLIRYAVVNIQRENHVRDDAGSWGKGCGERGDGSTADDGMRSGRTECTAVEISEGETSGDDFRDGDYTDIDE